mmetsp:Transcript_11060/g.19348  ORF Transcript_11060/g.19348 Transcript_11060/m.19348 type:complete len:528 (-) Transcript_11060:247-1830(-)|eukprot:CAMPEP_0196659712 /NCGR_PEP_ID=MMETSP1086-20130531/36348_1 /TAXON_ID=77921 /ORGANISM="Cyanoptyche  gloeocystis , Strain SAG4.97" /LENGTH=527 /DNA_ID=CAMNT_0041993795 /DNA_START=105 /DNA_END=1688 /DNA_ORIENTATION=+
MEDAEVKPNIAQDKKKKKKQTKKKPASAGSNDQNDVEEETEVAQSNGQPQDAGSTKKAGEAAGVAESLGSSPEKDQAALDKEALLRQKREEIAAKVAAAKKERERQQLEEEKKNAMNQARQKKEEGNKLFAQKQYEEAAKSYTEALQISPPDFEERAIFLSNRAQCYLSLQRFEAAIEDSTQSLQLQPHNVKTLMRRGAAYQRLKNVDSALADFRQCLELSPGLEEAVQSIKAIENERTGKSISPPPAADSPAEAPPSSKSPEPDEMDTIRTKGSKNLGKSPAKKPSASAKKATAKQPKGYPQPPLPGQQPWTFPMMYVPTPVAPAPAGDDDSDEERGDSDDEEEVAQQPAYTMMPMPMYGYPYGPMMDPSMFQHMMPGQPAPKPAPPAEDAGKGTGSEESGPRTGGPPTPTTTSHDILQLVYSYVAQVRAEMQYYENHPGELSIEKLLQVQREVYELNHISHVLSNVSVSHNQMLVNLILKVGSVQDPAYYDQPHVHTEECFHGHQHPAADQADKGKKKTTKDSKK